MMISHTGNPLGATAKFPRNSFAFKWADEQKETTLLEIEWSPSRTGLINPVAIFDRWSWRDYGVQSQRSQYQHYEKPGTWIGDRIEVYKANMIIPQIAENRTRSGVKDIPDTCPACKGPTKIQMVNDVETLYCVNPDVPAKAIKTFTLFVSRMR